MPRPRTPFSVCQRSLVVARRTGEPWFPKDERRAGLLDGPGSAAATAAPSDRSEAQRDSPGFFRRFGGAVTAVVGSDGKKLDGWRDVRLRGYDVTTAVQGGS
eukprot:6712864-Prymnesium_polylepis.4